MTTPQQTSYSPSEMMIAAAARALGGVRTVFVGVGLPNIACNLARHTVAPQLELIYEAGVYGARPSRLPLSIGDPTLVSGAISVVSMADLFGLYLQGGLVEAALLGGACEIAINARRLLYIMRLKRRAFVERLDFVTSPGHLGGGDARRKMGVPGDGPQLVITDKALFDFANPEREMQLAALHPGVTLDEVRAEVGWPLRAATTIASTPAPTVEELHMIRVELDPQAMYR